MTSPSDKVAVITGASRGIGAALVEAYRKQGYSVVATARQIVPGDAPGVLAVPGDISDLATADEVVDGALHRFGRVDTLVNNAGIFLAKPFVEYTDDDYASMVGTNLTGFFALTRRAIGAMLQHGEGGHVVTLTTSLTVHANSKVPSVLASLTKGGLDAATRSLAIEYARRGIRVNAVSPGIIDSPMQAGRDHQALGEMHPVGHIGQISDIVEAVLYLEHAPFVTGESLHVDGGQAAGH